MQFPNLAWAMKNKRSPQYRAAHELSLALAGGTGFVLLECSDCLGDGHAADKRLISRHEAGVVVRISNQELT